MRKLALNAKQILSEIKGGHNEANLAGMRKFGITITTAHGIPVPRLRRMAREAGKDSRLAEELWKSGVHEARILAGMVADPRFFTEKQMDVWVREFDSWDVCDQCCSNLFSRTPHAFRKAAEWTSREEEFVKRAGFALMAALAVHDKKAADGEFEKMLGMVEREALDERNFVRKAVNWALRQIGKRNRKLNSLAIKTARRILSENKGSKAARWVAGDALRELTDEKVRKRLKE